MTLLMREKEIAEENFEKGIKEGMKEGIINQVRILKEFNISKKEIIERIVRDYKITEEEAKTYL